MRRLGIGWLRVRLYVLNLTEWVCVLWRIVLMRVLVTVLNFWWLTVAATCLIRWCGYVLLGIWVVFVICVVKLLCVGRRH